MSLGLYLIQIICILLSNQFILCTQKVQQTPASRINDLEDIVSEYEELRCLVSKTDKMFMVLNGVMMSYGILSVCFMGYALIVKESGPDFYYGYIKYMVSGVINICFICGSAAYLNSCVSSIYLSTLTQNSYHIS